MIHFDVFVHAKDEALLKAYEHAAKSIPVLIKTAGAGDVGVPIRLAAIELLGKFGADAQAALPVLKSFTDDPALTKATGTALSKAAQDAAIAIEKEAQKK